MTNVIQIKSKSTLEAHATRIRTLMEDWASNTIVLGKELREAQENFPTTGRTNKRPGWNAWLKEVGVSKTHAGNLIKVAEKFGTAAAVPKMGQKILVLLSRDNVPESGRKDVLDRLNRGEKVGRKEVKKIVDSHRPKPKEADRQARETGKAVLASDGYIYLGSDKEDVAAATERRTVVFAVRRAIGALAQLQLTPQQFLDTALKHQLHGLDIQEIRKAAKWLEGLTSVWSRK